MCGDHCSVHAPSDDKAKEFSSKCKHEHTYECERCEELESVLDDIGEVLTNVEMDEEERSRLQFEYKESVRNIKAWEVHLLRSINQEEAKQYAMQQLNEDTRCDNGLGKFLPVQFREQMSDFFGKRGRSWHISAVITAASATDRKYEVECFVHILNSCNQNNFAVLSIIEDLLHNVKQEYPAVTKAYLRSDNAGC